jgi:hypothetical protein
MPVRSSFVPLLLCLLTSGCSDLLVTAPDESDNLADFEAACSTVQKVYPFMKFKQINWDSLHMVYLPRAEAARGDEIDQVLVDLLAELKDGHVRVQTAGGASVATYHPPRAERDRGAYSPLVVRNYFSGELRTAGNQRVEYGVTEGGFGYIYVATLVENDPVLAGFDEALMYLRDTPALIIDVRHNGGGSDNNSIAIVARLISARIANLPYADAAGNLQPGPFIYPRGPFQYTKPVVLLVNGVCFSSCEDFAAMMSNVPTVTIVGDTTAGGSGAPQLFALPSGRKIRLSTLIIRRFDGQPIEWNGVVPDVRVAQTAADINQGKDPQLEYALWFLSLTSSKNRNEPWR